MHIMIFSIIIYFEVNKKNKKKIIKNENKPKKNIKNIFI